MQQEILERLLREALLKRNQKKQERVNKENNNYNYHKQEYDNRKEYNRKRETRHPLWKYHMILGVSVHSTRDEIKSAYRKLALKYHPDKNKSPDAELQIRQLNEAAEKLGVI